MEKVMKLQEIKGNKRKYSGLLINIAPYLGLIIGTIVFQVLTEGKLLTISNIQNLTNQVIITALVAVGGVFLFGIGCFDMSLGALVCIGSVLGGMTAIETGNLFLAFIVCMLVPLFAGFLKGIFASYVEVPFFIFTIILAIVINSLVLILLGTETTIYLDNAISEIRTFSFAEMTLINILILASYYLISLFIFNYTSMGIKVKMIGGNPKSAQQTGINIKKVKILSFFFSAIGIGLAAFLILIRVRTVGFTTATTTGNDVMVALVLGGMPISGGPRTKISAGIVGAATITILNSGLAIMGLSTGIVQGVRGIVFIVVVLVASFSYRTKMLPR